MSHKLKKGSLQFVLLLILGLSAIFSVVAFATNVNPAERPVVYAVCVINPTDIVCQDQTLKP